MAPTIGRIVHYTLSGQDADAVNRHRDTCSITNVGNPASEGDVFPMMIVRVWPGEELVQGQVFLDGNDVLWVTSVAEGTGPRTFAWPARS